MGLVFKEKYHLNPPLSSISSRPSRLLDKEDRQRRLHSKYGFIQSIEERKQSMDKPRLGYVCQPRQQKISELRNKIPLLGMQKDRLPTVPFTGHKRMLCQPPLDSNRPVVNKTERTPTPNLLGDCALLGFNVLVAPFGQNAGARKPCNSNRSLSRHVQELPGRGHAPPKVAPPLHCIIKQILEGRKISVEGVQTYLEKLKNLDRYDSAFNQLWLKLLEKGEDPLKADLNKVAEAILLLDKENKNQARNAYAACTHIPGYEQIRFHQLLTKCKRNWNQNTPKYPIFWDASTVIEKISQQPLNWKSIEALRDRLIICMRLLGLFRSIDLERWYRKLSFIDQVPFIWVQRKGWPAARWEQLLCMPERPDLCPFTLLKAYVNLTKGHCATSSQVLITLKSPFKAIKADTIGSITKRILSKNGIPPNFGGHIQPEVQESPCIKT